MADPFIDTSYFSGNIDIPFENKDTSSFNSKYIVPLEEYILVKILGRKLYDEFITGINEATPDQKWIDLRDGVLFDIEHNGNEYPIKWNGLINTEKKSLISYYIYIEWLKGNYTQLLGTGIAISDKKNAKTVDVREKYLFAENQAVNLIGEYPIAKTELNKIVLPDDMDVDYIKIFEPTLLNFLYHNKDDYTSWVFSPLKKSNYWDI